MLEGRAKLTWPIVGMVAISLFGAAVDAVPTWTSPNHYRILLTVDPLAVTRLNAPAMIKNLNFQGTLGALGSTGTFDENTIEVVAYDASGLPVVFDNSRPGYEKYLLPCRLDPYYGVKKWDLAFVIPNQAYTQYAAYFDTVESGLGKPQRYQGIVGDGDWYREGYKRREATAGHMEDFCDFDLDGDLDLFRVTVESLIYCYENVGGNKLVYRGLMSSGGNTFVLPGSVNNRSWPLLEFDDWDGDGDVDLFCSFTVGPDAGHVVRFENVTPPGGNLTFSRVVDANNGRLLTVGGQQLSNGWFGAINIVDYDGDGKKDVISAPSDYFLFHRNIGPTNSMTNIQIADGVRIQAGGADIYFYCGKMECADIDSDGDLDSFAAGWGGEVMYYKNNGTRTVPVLAAGVQVATSTGAQVAVKPLDWDGDGLIDLAVGQYWHKDGQFGRLWKNVGTLSNPQFQARDAYNGCPYTEQFQPCAIGRQNGVRASDWDNDGDMDLIAGDQWGDVYIFRNTTNQLFPIYAAPEYMLANGAPIDMGAYSRMEICDWKGDGKKDLLVSDDYARVWYYQNIGTDANPVLAAGQQLYSYRSGGSYLPIGGDTSGTHSSIMVCYWDTDAKKDLILADASYFYFYQNIGTDTEPILAAPQTITTSDGVPITYVRPNLGSYVDWDLDGRPDFLACKFEDCIYYYRNKGWNANGTPKLAQPVTLVLPWCNTQMIQGVDARDWNGDSDRDILTGQGHGGNGFRFYERNYVNDYVNNTYPIVTNTSSQRGLEIAEAKAKANGSSVNLPKGVVTAPFTGYFYVESDDRLSGMRVDKAAHGRSVGERVDVVGSMATTADGERYIAATTLTLNGSGTIAEMVVNQAALGGGDKDYDPGTGAGQMGVTGGAGLNNIGLLVRICGRCALNVRGDYYGKNYIFIDDGSGITSFYRASEFSYVEVAGVKVEVDDATVALDDYVTARGISSIELVNGVHQRRILPRTGLGDVQKL